MGDRLWTGKPSRYVTSQVDDSTINIVLDIIIIITLYVYATDIWYSEEGAGRAAASPSPLLTVPNVTAYPSTAIVPTSYYSMWHCNYICTVWG